MDSNKHTYDYSLQENFGPCSFFFKKLVAWRSITIAKSQHPLVALSPIRHGLIFF